MFISKAFQSCIGTAVYLYTNNNNNNTVESRSRQHFLIHLFI